MPLPSALTPLLTDRQFWMHYFYRGYDAFYPQLKGCVVEPMISTDYGFRLPITQDLKKSRLELLYPDVSLQGRDRGGRTSPVASLVGWDNGSPLCSHCLRWDELDLLGRCVALADPTLPHPGVLVVLLMHFAPICVDDDVDVVRAIIYESCRSVGLEDYDVRSRFQDIDKRLSRFAWTRDTARRWTISHSEDRRTNRPVHTLRKPENDDFPHQQLAEAFADAAHRYADARPAQWHSWRGGMIVSMASQIAADGDMRDAGVLADALEDCDEAPECVLQALRQKEFPVRAWMAVEMIAGAPRGSLVKQWQAKGEELRERIWQAGLAARAGATSPPR
jgi:hypothetical protein